MNFAFFENLSPQEAHDYLERFLVLGNEALPDLVSAAETDGVVADLSLDRIERVVEWVAHHAETIPLAPDLDLPEWIRASDTYEASMFDFDEPSKVLILRLAFYVGESFARAFPQLSWGVGRKDTAPQGQPVITGFMHGMEMPVLVVAENLVARATFDDPPASDAARAVSVWESKVPN